MSSNIPSSPAYGVFISQLIRYARACSSYECFILRAFEIVSKEVLWSVWGSYQTIWGSPLPNVTRHSGGWPYTVTPSIDQTLQPFFYPLLIWTLIPNLTFNLIVWSFHRTFAAGAACQQRTLTPPDTWSCPTLGLACVLMSRPIPPELVLFPDFWVSNIPRYFCFCIKKSDHASASPGLTGCIMLDNVPIS